MPRLCIINSQYIIFLGMVKYEPLFDNITHYPPGTNHVFLTHPYYMHRDSISLAIFNDHRFAFYFWALWRDKNLSGPIDLISLDWHQDLAYPEESQKEELRNLDLTNTFETAFYSWARLATLKDDHIVAAIYKNIVRDVYIVCKQDMAYNNQDECIVDMYGNNHTIKKFQSTLEAYDYLSKTSIDKVFFYIDLDFFTIENISTNFIQRTSFVKESAIRIIMNRQSNFILCILE